MSAKDTGTCSGGDKSTAYEAVLITLTLPLWSYVTLTLLLLLIHYLRSVQYTTIYDKCNSKNAHFQYNFHIIIGRHTHNYSKFDSHLIVDLLDNQLVPTVTVQLPGATVFNDSQVFTYRHTRNNLRCVNFTIYRKNPIKDVRGIRVAHNCNNPDSRIFIYGVNLHDKTNAENKFFPILSVVKYRGTQWALNTHFDPKNDTSFKKLGCDCHDPFSFTNWPTYAETLLIIFYVWSACLCFGNLISVESVISSVTLHALTISFIAGTSAVVIGLVYLKLIKNHIIDKHYDSNFWMLLQVFVFFLIMVLSFAFWSLATGQLQSCKSQSIDWIKSCVSSASILTVIILVIYFVLRVRRRKQDRIALEESDNTMMKTNSRQNLEFVKESSSFTSCFFQKTSFQNIPPQQPSESKKSTATQKSNQTRATTGSAGSSATKMSSGTVQTKRSPSFSRKKSNTAKPSHNNDDKNNNNNNDKKEETLDNAFAYSSGVYMKTKNRNSISQYV